MIAKGILVTRADPLPEFETEWNNWYKNKHLPEMMDQVPGILAARRYKAVDTELKNIIINRDQPRYWTIYDLASVDVLEGEAYLKLRKILDSMPPDSFEARTPRMPNALRTVYEQIYQEPGEYRMPGTRFIFAVGHSPPADQAEEYHAWCNTEHIPAMRRVPGFLAARRFRATDAEDPARADVPWHAKYLTLYDLEDPEIINTDAFLRERDSPWSAWVRRWFNRRFTFVGRRIHPE